MLFFKPQSQGSFKFCITVQFHERQLPCIFFSSNIIYFGQKESIEVKFLGFWVIGWKFTKFLISCLKQQVSFSSNFSLLFSVMRDNSSVSSSWYCTWFGQRELIKVDNFKLSTAHVKFHQICILLKVYKFQLKKYRRVMCHDTE